MNWLKLVFALVVILLYLPLVFMGANVFFPQYTGSDSYYAAYKDCSIYPQSTTEPVRFNQTCQDEQTAAQKAFEQEKNAYDGNKYIFIVLLNLLVLLVALFMTLNDAVIIGLFIGSTLTTFSSTWIYFGTKSKIGFGILLVIFFVTLYFISRKKHSFMLK